jgi:hypothetical protein
MDLQPYDTECHDTTRQTPLSLKFQSMFWKQPLETIIHSLQIETWF